MPLLSVKDLAVEFATYGGTVKAVRGVSFDVFPQETLAIVGESGCGKSVTFQTLMGLIPKPPGKVTGGRADFQHLDLLSMTQRQLEGIRGKDISMIFQDPMTSLNPTMKVGQQIAEVIIRHRGISRREAMAEVVDLMQLTQIPEAASRVHQYPHEFSGGMRQRVMIAIALACRPKILIADEPTTALDVTIQGQILALLKSLQREIGMAVVLITHDLGVVASVADRVAVMYAGQIVETGTVDEIFYESSHPYTLGLRRAIPNPLNPDFSALRAIPGSPPDLFSPPTGCGFSARCPHALEVCDHFSPPQFKALGAHKLIRSKEQGERYAACWLHHEATPKSFRDNFVMNARLSSKALKSMEAHQ
ncbi:MAG: ABC transporter ATP-binding protein [Proteobacteria bacterium]|nr:ABC transporter ATP-binding protein [Pseudomonadota bacterium]